MKFLSSTTSTVLYVIFAVISQVIVDADGQEISDALKGNTVPTENCANVHLGLTSNLYDAANGLTSSFIAGGKNDRNGQQLVQQGTLRKHRDLKGKGKVNVPSNDICTKARLLKIDGKAVKGTTVGATMEYGLPGVWYNLELASDECVSITMCNAQGFYPYFNYMGSSCDVEETNLPTDVGAAALNYCYTQQYYELSAGANYFLVSSLVLSRLNLQTINSFAVKIGMVVFPQLGFGICPI
jgi:hypothetical protein